MGTIPGVPVVLTGRSEALGWGLTSAYLDDQDVYIEELNPDNPQEYRTPGGFKEFVSRPSIITIKDADPVTVTLRWSAGRETPRGTSVPSGSRSRRPRV